MAGCKPGRAALASRIGARRTIATGPAPVAALRERGWIGRGPLFGYELLRRLGPLLDRIDFHVRAGAVSATNVKHRSLPDSRKLAGLRPRQRAGTRRS